jgi:N-acetylmuramoyl-L-alanine amidase
VFNFLHCVAWQIFASTLFVSFGAVTLRSGSMQLAEIADRCGASATYENGGKICHVCGKNFKLQCKQNSACYSINGVNVYGQYPVAGDAWRLRLNEQDWEKIIAPLLKHQAIGQVTCVCIDPGHGGSDPGSQVVRGGMCEKQLTLDIAQRVQMLLEARGIVTVLTRRNDSFVALKDRSAIANSAKCDLFVSIHFNAAENVTAEGIETYILPCQGMHSTARQQNTNIKDKEFFPNNLCDKFNLYLGYCLQRELSRIHSVNDRGLRCGRFLVLESTRCPAALVECGFLTGNHEGQRIANEQYRQKIAQAICDGICAYGSIR